MRCLECGAHNADNARFCERCHAPLVGFYDAAVAQAGAAATADDAPNARADVTWDAASSDARVTEQDATQVAPVPAPEPQGSPRTVARVPSARSTDGPVGVSFSAKGDAPGASKATSALRRMLGIVIDVALALGVSFLPWMGMRAVHGAVLKTIPELAMGLFPAITAMISATADAASTGLVIVGLVAAGVWGTSIYFLATDAYYDAVGRSHAHGGLACVALGSAVTLGGAYYLNVSASGTGLSPLAMFEQGSAAAVMLSVWPPVLLGVTVVAAIVALALR